MLFSILFVQSTLPSLTDRGFFFELPANFGFPLITTTYSIFSVVIVATTLLLLGVFLPHTGEFTRFLHRLGFVYLIFFLWLESTGVAFRFEALSTESSLEIRQEDSIYFRLFLIYSTLTVAIFFFGVAERFFFSKRGRLEFPILIFFLHFGGLFALRLHTFMDLLIALERVTLASYVLVTFERQNRFSTYAGVQYFIIGSLPSARLILAFGLFYLQGGTIAIQDLDLLLNAVTAEGAFDSTKFTTLSLIQDYITLPLETIEVVSTTLVNTNSESNWASWITSVDTVSLDTIIASVNPISSLTVRGLFFLRFNLFFKLTAAPFHVWAPSVYGKSPIASVTFLSIYSKARVLFLLFKFLNTFLHSFSLITLILFFVIGVLSILVGRVGAFSEKLIKRFFVYSSMGHVGFRLVGLGLMSIEGASARFHYLAVYILSSFVMWFTLLTRGRNKSHLVHFSELKSIDPFIALLFAFLVFSRSGIPPLGGFFIKLDILAALLDTSHYFTNYLLFFCTVASFFYYLRVIKILFFDEQTQTSTRSNTSISFGVAYTQEYPRYVGRLWIRVSVIVLLAVYLFVVQKPLLSIQFEVLSSLFLYFV